MGYIGWNLGEIFKKMCSKIFQTENQVNIKKLFFDFFAQYWWYSDLFYVPGWTYTKNWLLSTNSLVSELLFIIYYYKAQDKFLKAHNQEN